jgi:methylenetetrahydrofolate dehydrogenase (NADP+)/methenyltetrahydrofolate cyclohydrolase
MSTIIDGKGLAKSIKIGLRGEVALLNKKGITPGLAVVLVGDDPASQIYVKAKEKACEEVGIASFQHRLNKDVTEDEVLRLISGLNKNEEVHGILIQLPLPPHLNERILIEAINPDKDVDGFHPYNIGRLVIGAPYFQPCTPLGIMRLLESTGIDLSGKEAVVVGRSNIVGKPVALMLLHRNATVTICHSRTVEIGDKVSRADIVIAAVGKARMVKGEWIKKGAIVIDVGINRTADGKLLGDVDFEGASKKASYITPVPGGVGPMTIAMLLYNTVLATNRQRMGR